MDKTAGTGEVHGSLRAKRPVRARSTAGTKNTADAFTVFSGPKKTTGAFTVFNGALITGQCVYGF